MRRIATILIVVFMSAMIAVAFWQIILRNFFGTGLSWADITVRDLVLWVGFFGAILATIQDRHITLDVFSRLLPEKLKKHIHSAICLGSAIVCGFLTYASYKFVASERVFGGELFLGVPIWWAQVIIPMTFGIMGMVFLVRGYSKCTF